ncbi:DNA-directed RNA polymerase II subunit RPB1-like isoform X2 [Penaeus monodon]|nr:DNA-directed RNA polymerase II subunit RPB1-like isoform X2 [Penaeus monodon]XP_037786930.1 DNA-directed RNA polymerase II subunit RPB1-like isoform X2 [Penaeus monodon]XP_037786931.1 DNA-directed RNA polymerase II subunit RPB1-like isoform X2 [Penaeus monodon]XP_037786932.1 DNA-directed RNA polymerase II subunit RPB1-like isoform X2 [Penaeus monodon]XP_037786933.1 DNA-directed RNA polymerase II subunit RPB1-like isoform X2 [Penaeus monodon]XP_037786934.1 DNA-directed RNA polymerase II subu
MSQNQASTVPAPGQTVQIVPQQLPSGSFSNGKYKLVAVMLSILFGIIIIISLTSSDVLAHSALGVCITVAVIGIILLVSYRICKSSGGSPGRVIQSGPLQTVPQQNTYVLQHPGNMQTGYPLSPPLHQNMAPGSLSATYTYTPLNSSTAGSNNSYVGKKDFYSSGFPRQTPTTGASSSASYAPYPTTSASFPRSPEYQPPPSFAPGFSPTSYDQAPPYGHIPGADPTIGVPSASAPEFDPPPPYAPPPYEK